MPRAAAAPKYSLHKASGQAYVWFGGRMRYLGPYRSRESLALHAQILASGKRRSSSGRRPIPSR